MAITESAEIVIDATPAEILAVMADVESMPTWSRVHESVEVLDRDDRGRPTRAKLKVRLFGVSDTHELAYSWRDDGVSWSLVESAQQRSQDARYELTEQGSATQVHFEIVVEPLIPLPAFLIRRARQPFVDTATRALRARVMSLKAG